MDNDQEVELQLDTVDNIRALLKEGYGDQFKSYYDGDPGSIPAANLPAVCIIQPALRVRLDATATDQFDTEVTIKILLNKKDDFNKSDDVDLTERRLRRLIQAKDKATRTYAKGTMLHTLRTLENMQLGGVTLDWQMDVKYGQRERANMVVTSEAHISIIARERVIRPGYTVVN